MVVVDFGELQKSEEESPGFCYSARCHWPWGKSTTQTDSALRRDGTDRESSSFLFCKRRKHNYDLWWRTVDSAQRHEIQPADSHVWPYCSRCW